MKKTVIALMLATSAPLAAHASESNGLGYSNVQLEYTHTGYSMDGVGVSGSYELSDNFFVTGRYARATDSETWMGLPNDTKQKSWTLGIGFNAPIGPRADWVSQLAFERADVSGHNVTCYTAIESAPRTCRGESWSDRARGYSLSTGIRGRITEKVTANAYAGYEDYSGYDGSWFADLGVGYNFTPTWSIEAGVRVTEYDEQWKLGVRVSF